MPAYMVAEVEFIPGPALDRYRALAGAAIAAHGGTFLVRGQEKALTEGEHRFRRVIIVAFPSLDAAERWYRSAEYAEALRASGEAMHRTLYLVDGVPP
ncbi:DUF1330 domain-containing protein [Roseomonas populi]|uniref:DUF1330 domain-containing protein n=1 Tax=Roseomonas populi TaxID=3121582 RepID=A0ABT1X9X3_9PROT|nr:DUF1330 domain-containing protein [Roseomonas pecuniae]MCR0984911.1 DUF1330 domain-containing protein [Roseomonas pecuniae]